MVLGLHHIRDVFFEPSVPREEHERSVQQRAVRHVPQAAPTLLHRPLLRDQGSPPGQPREAPFVRTAPPERAHREAREQHDRPVR